MVREYIIKISDEVMEDEFSDRPQELIRCCDCKYAFFKEGLVAVGRIFCTKPGTERGQAVKTDIWFCADGERKEGR